jgi:hypothetical protein
MTRYKLTFYADVWADDPTHAFREAADYVGNLPTPPASALGMLPTGAATGAPRTPDGPGWMVVFEIKEAD